MNQVLVAVLLVVAITSVAIAQEEYKCETPKVWYAHFYDFSPSRREERFGRFYYDEDNKRIARRENVTQGLNYTDFYDEIFLHEEQVGYRINVRTKECSKFSLTDPFPIIGPYLDDSYQGEAFIGSSISDRDGVRVQMYSGSNERGQFFGVWIPAEEGTCFPVSETYTRISDRSSSTMRWYDIRLGVLDPDVFIPPPNC